MLSANTCTVGLIEPFCPSLHLFVVYSLNIINRKMEFLKTSYSFSPITIFFPQRKIMFFFIAYKTEVFYGSYFKFFWLVDTTHAQTTSFLLKKKKKKRVLLLAKSKIFSSQFVFTNISFTWSNLLDKKSGHLEVRFSVGVSRPGEDLKNSFLDCASFRKTNKIMIRSLLLRTQCLLSHSYMG